MYTHTHTDMQGNIIMTCKSVDIYIHAATECSLRFQKKKEKPLVHSLTRLAREPQIYAVPLKWVPAEKEKVLGF